MVIAARGRRARVRVKENGGAARRTGAEECEDLSDDALGDALDDVDDPRTTAPVIELIRGLIPRGSNSTRMLACGREAEF